MPSRITLTLSPCHIFELAQSKGAIARKARPVLLISGHMYLKSLQHTFTVAHIIPFSFHGEDLLIPFFLPKFILVLLWQYHCRTTTWFASMELNASFLSRCDPEVEA
jgi:hypothetical protein